MIVFSSLLIGSFIREVYRGCCLYWNTLACAQRLSTPTRTLRGWTHPEGGELKVEEIVEGGQPYLDTARPSVRLSIRGAGVRTSFVHDSPIGFGSAAPNIDVGFARKEVHGFSPSDCVRRAREMGFVITYI